MYLFIIRGFTSILGPMWLIDHIEDVGGSLFSDLQQLLLIIIREEMSAIYWEQTAFKFQHTENTENQGKVERW